MAKFRPIKKHGTGLERWKDEKTGKEWRKTGLLIQRKIGKSGKTRSMKEKTRKKPRKRKIFLNGNAFLSVPVPTNFSQRTSLVRSSVQNATSDSNNFAQKCAHTQTRMAHNPRDHKVVRARQRTQKFTQHSTANAQPSQQTMVTKRERRYNRYYPTGAVVAVLVSNETHWYMLPIKLLCPQYYTANVCQLARYCLLAHPDYIFF